MTFCVIIQGMKAPSEAGRRDGERFVSVFDDPGEPLNYLEVTRSTEDADAMAAFIGEGLNRLQDDNPQVQGVLRALQDAREGGAKFVLLSDNLPVDAARFTEADAIVCAYLSAGFGMDPAEGSENAGAYNANVPAALCAIFGDGDMPGRLPINIPALEQDANGAWAYGSRILYERGCSALDGAN